MRRIGIKVKMGNIETKAKMRIGIKEKMRNKKLEGR